MDNSEPLVIQGLAIILLSAAAIIVPWFRRRADAITAWNLVLLGGALFMGIGSLAVRYGDFHWPELQWFQPTPRDVQRFIIGMIAFYGTLFFSYYMLRWPRAISRRCFNKWPPISTKLVVLLVIFGLGTTVVAPLVQGIVFVGPFFRNVCHKGIVFAVVISVCHWYKNRRQPQFLILMLGVFVFSALEAMVLFAGRRLLLSVVVAPFICMYWLSWRYQSVRSNLIRLGLATMIAVSTAAVYSTFRHLRGSELQPKGRSIATMVEALKGTSAQSAVRAVTNNAYFYFSQYCGHYTLLTLHLLDSGALEVEPLNTLYYVAAFPVPRAIWPQKPKPLSDRIVRQVLRMPYGTNWGLGIAGDGYHQGGIPVIMLYAFLLVVLVRILDDPLTRQPDNVFLLAVLCTTAPHFAAWIRGDSGIMTTEIGEAMLFAWALGLIGRLFFGTAPTDSGGQPRTLQQPIGHLRHAGR